jgi:hypothetical protein
MVMDNDKYSAAIAPPWRATYVTVSKMDMAHPSSSPLWVDVTHESVESVFVKTVSSARSPAEVLCPLVPIWTMREEKLLPQTGA